MNLKASTVDCRGASLQTTNSFPDYVNILNPMSSGAKVAIQSSQSFNSPSATPSVSRQQATSHDF